MFQLRGYGEWQRKKIPKVNGRTKDYGSEGGTGVRYPRYWHVFALESIGHGGVLRVDPLITVRIIPFTKGSENVNH